MDLKPLPLLSPLSFLPLSSQYSSSQEAKKAQSPTETLATQANYELSRIFLRDREVITSRN